MAESGGGTIAVAPRAWKVLGVTALGAFVVFLDTTVVNIAFRAIEEEFAGTSRATLSWVFTAYSIVLPPSW